MKTLLAGFALFTLAGCATVNTQPANVLLTVLAAAATYQQFGCIPPVATTDPIAACAPVTSTDQKVIDAAIQACLTATVTQLVMANVKVPKCATVPTVPPPVPVPVPAPQPIVVPGPVVPKS